MKQMMIVAALGMVASSFAQSAPVLDTNGLSLRVGGAYPFQNGVRNALGNPFALGLDVTTPQSYIKNTTSYLSFDYYAKQIGQSKYFIPVMLNSRFGMQSDSGRDTYAFVGLGPIFANVGASATLFGVRGGFGAKFGEHLFGEVALMFSTENNGARADNIGVFIGYKF